jgi:hypothetical protein
VTPRGPVKHLGAVSRSLVDSDLAWADPVRFSSPQDFIWFALRALE